MLKPGMILCDRYEILEVVGAGGMSIVYKARCHRLNRNVAIKVLKPEFSNDKNFVSKFKIEAQASAGLTHPNIVNVYDVYDDDGIYFIVMELVDGITLKEYIEKNGRLDMDTAIDFSIQIASGLEAAHDSHIIHRDIKPQNIIVAKNGNIKVTDFGIAKATTSNTLTSGAMGSVHYISPEQARGGYSDERSDIYSLGITMYEMVTGRVPFEGDNNVSVALMHIQSDIIPPRQYYPDIYSSFEKVIMKATQKKPERRYLTASALIADLKRVQNNPNIDIVVAPTAITNSPTQEWTKADVQAIRDGSAARDPYSNSQLDTFSNNVPIQNEMGELKATGGISAIPVNNKINQLLDDEVWDDEDDEYEDEQVSRKGNLKKVRDEDYDEDDEDDNSDMDPNLKMAVTIAGIATAVIIAIIIFIFLGKIMGLFGKSKKDPTTTDTTTEEVLEKAMLDVVGLEQEAAKSQLDKEGFTNIKIETAENSDVQAGYVFDQSIKKNEIIPLDEEIILYVSAGSEPVAIPSVVGLDEESAYKLLDQEGFIVKYAYEYSDTVEKNKVISQSPEGNQSAAKGSTVTITISNGKESKPATVPNLKGLTEDQARTSLESVKLVVGTVSHQNDPNVPEGQVISQSHPQGTTLEEGDKVDFVISDGPEEVNITYTANISGTVMCNDPVYDGQAVTIRILFGEDVVKDEPYTVTAGTSFSVSGTKTGLSEQPTDSNVADIVVIDASGNNITNVFSTSTSITYTEVRE
ncbi:MAG: Stk1 family PASTA domain-containing Ser/Thr kinase [Wujia sp.]